MFEMPSRSKEKTVDKPRKRPPNYFARREQMRLLVLVGSLMLVFILMIEAGKPKNWEWLWAMDKDRLTDAETTDEEIDTRLPPTPNPETQLAPDVFISPADEPPPEDPDPAEQEEGYFPGVKPHLLSAVRDDMLLLPKENEAWYHLLSVLQNADQAELEKASLGRVGFVQLFQQAQEYRGKLVTIRGTVRRATKETKVPENAHGIKSYWRMCFSPSGTPNYVIFVYALDMPDGFKEAKDMREEVEFTGFSYKRMAYQAEGKTAGGETRTAPLVLAKIGQWAPPPPDESPEATPWMVAVSLAGATLFAIGLAMYVYLRGGRVSETAEEYSTLGKAKPGALETLEQTDLGPDVREQLDKIASDDAL